MLSPCKLLRLYHTIQGGTVDHNENYLIQVEGWRGAVRQDELPAVSSIEDLVESAYTDLVFPVSASRQLPNYQRAGLPEAA